MSGGRNPGATPAPDFLILGAGALGRLWGACLAQRPVAFVPRKAGQTGHCRYCLQDAGGRTLAVSIPWHWPHPERPPRLILVTTKAQDTLPALADLLAQVPVEVPVVLFQNGMGSQQLVARAHPERPILAASTTEGANRPDAHTLVHAGRGETWVGPMTAPARPVLEAVVAALAQSGLVLHRSSDIQLRLLRKVAVNAGINPFTALLDCRNGEILTKSLYRDHIDELCREIAGLMAALGLEQTPAALREEIEAVAMRTASNTSSMLADVRQGRATEIDFINGWLADQCQARDLPHRVNRMLTERVKALSSTH